MSETRRIVVKSRKADFFTTSQLINELLLDLKEQLNLKVVIINLLFIWDHTSDDCDANNFSTPHFSLCPDHTDNLSDFTGHDFVEIKFVGIEKSGWSIGLSLEE